MKNKFFKMKKMLFLALLATQLHAGQKFISFGGDAGNVWHLTGSCIGTLAIQKTFKVKWYKAAGIMLAAGIAWELLDEAKQAGGLHTLDFFDPAGFDKKDVYRDMIGIALSYPLRYKNWQINITIRRAK
jgi:hypothetical protein